MLSLALLLLFNLLGFLLAAYAHIPLPANVLGLVLLLIALCTGVVKLRHVEPAANFLLQHMLLLFAPIIASTLALTPLLAADWPTFAAICAFATPATLLATAGAARLFLPRHHRHPASQPS